MTTYQRMVPYLWPYAGISLVSGMLLAGESAVNLALPKLIGHFIDAGALRRPLSSLTHMLLVLAGAFLVRYSFVVGETYLLGSAAARFVARLRAEACGRLLSAPLGFHTEQCVGDLISRLIDDVSLLHSIVADHLASLVTGIFMFVGGATLLLFLDWRMTVWLFVVAPPVLLMIRVIGTQLQLAVKNVQQKRGEMMALASEYLHAIETVKASGYERECRAELCELLGEVLAAALRRVRIQMVFQPAMGLLSFAIFAALAWAGTSALATGRLSPGIVVSFLLYAGAVGAATTSLAGQYGRLQEALGAADRVLALLEAPPEREPSNQVPLPAKLQGEIEFRHVAFSYVPDVSLLQDISFRAPAGALVALVGPSGTGKSTLLYLMLKFYDPDAGVIAVDGMDLRLMDHREWRRQIGYLPQHPQLFRGTIRSNLTFGLGQVSMEGLEETAKAAQIHDFISNLPQGCETHVGEGGVTLSGGQRQRIALARAMLKDPPIVLLDEPTSALDRETARLLCENLRAWSAGRTVLVVTDDPQLINHADRVVSLRDGRIEG